MDASLRGDALFIAVADISSDELPTRAGELVPLLGAGLSLLVDLPCERYEYVFYLVLSLSSARSSCVVPCGRCVDRRGICRMQSHAVRVRFFRIGKRGVGRRWR